jgi:hypothetical protein
MTYTIAHVGPATWEVREHSDRNSFTVVATHADSVRAYADAKAR